MADTTQTPDRQDNTGRWVLLSTIMASSMGFIMGSALNVALPALQGSLGADAGDLLWITNSYLLMLAALILVGGSLGDHYGRKRVFGYGIILFTIGSAICGFAPNVEVLIGARVLQGIGGAAMIPGSLAIISAYFDDEERGGAIGLWSAFTAVTTVGGPIIGGFLADPDIWSGFLPEAVAQGMWRGVFFITLPLALLALYALYTRVPESRDEEAAQQPLDWVGSVLATLGLASVSFGLIQAGENGFLSTGLAVPGLGVGLNNLAVLIIGVVVLVLFVLWEGRSNHPMMPLALYRSPVFSGANLLTLLLYAALQTSFFFLSLNLIQAQGYRASIAGFATVPLSLMLIVMSQYMGDLSSRIGPRIPLTVGPAVAGVGFALLALPGLTAWRELAANPDTTTFMDYLLNYATTYLPGILGVGIGMGITVAPLSNAVMSSVPQRQSGTASGVNNAASRTAGVLGIAAIGAVVLIQFNSTLMTRVEGLDLSPASIEALQAQAAELGGVQVPDGVPEEAAPQVEQAIARAFVDVFRTATWICAFLAWGSAAFAFFTMRVKPEEARQNVEQVLPDSA